VLAQAASLLESGLVDDTFMTKADVVLDRNGTRQLGELNRGKLWERTEKHEDFPNVRWKTSYLFIFPHAHSVKLQGAVLLPLILYADGTWLSKNGSHNIKPLAMTIGNFPRKVLNQDKAKKVMFYDIYFMIYRYFSLFRLSATCRSLVCRSPTAKRSAPKSSSASCITERFLTSCVQSAKLRSRGGSGRCWRAGIFHFTSSFLQDFSANITMRLPRCTRRTLFMPVVFAFVNDNPEGQLAANMFNSAQAKAPCRVCK
jgi:hypothetical protein